MLKFVLPYSSAKGTIQGNANHSTNSIVKGFQDLMSGNRKNETLLLYSKDTMLSASLPIGVFMGGSISFPGRT